MKKKLFTAGFALLLGTAHAEPTFRASNLRVLGDGGKLCYDAFARVDGKESAAYNKLAETRLKAMLSGMGLKADELDAADTCDRILSITFDMDNKGAPAVATIRLDLMSSLTLDNEQEIKGAIIWRESGWSANRGILTKAEIDKKFDRMLGDMFAPFKEDYAARARK